MRTQTITPKIAEISVSFPRKLKSFKNNINIGINTARNTLKPEERLHYNISENKNGDLLITIREKGFTNWLGSFFKKNKIQDTIFKEEFEHGLNGQFAATFFRLQMTLKLNNIKLI